MHNRSLCRALCVFSALSFGDFVTEGNVFESWIVLKMNCQREQCFLAIGQGTGLHLLLWLAVLSNFSVVGFFLARELTASSIRRNHTLISIFTLADAFRQIRGKANTKEVVMIADRYYGIDLFRWTDQHKPAKCTEQTLSRAAAKRTGISPGNFVHVLCCN